MTLRTFAGTTAVVTGAAHGIGRALALRLALAGSRVVVVDIRAEDAAAVVDELTAQGAPALAVACDVSSRADVAALGEQVAAWAPDGVQVLCNNAGVFTPRHAATATHEDWEWVLGVCLWGVIHGIEEFLPGMLESKRDCHILNTASMNGYLPSRHSTLYSTAKYGVVGLSETLRMELASTRVGVTLLNPAAVRTNISRAEEVRPERMTRSRQDPEDEAFADYGLSPALDPEQVADLALNAMSAGREAVFTDHVLKPLLEQRFARVLDAFVTLPSALPER
ncbi:SDR family NAD(P)-dependent oxidoreductase [Rhodococcus sp. T7]|uniref:SDR family NAD(P)-dependent oxidoreductase n=1 Tax=Rhodococcus sp. T7 TaxID=627444 RepID=UPI0013572690|nr:SDR family NAD(P)-dependent oxidoreductase [Rhodococcus sp. T7]KAF0962754.1 1-deoxy-11-beta-hydroxypentalenate dehydrogenase [Rhodococcus sp. T7]